MFNIFFSPILHESTNSEDSWCCVKMVIHNNVDSAIDFNSRARAHTPPTHTHTRTPCVWQLYENSLKNKDNTWDTKQPISPDLVSYYRENKSLMLHKYFKKFGMALTMQSLHQWFEVSKFQADHAALEELSSIINFAYLCPVFSRSGSFLTRAWWFIRMLARSPPSMPSEPV